MNKLNNIGIIGMEIYFPKIYVNQSELEKFDKVPSGKYTQGLGQKNMSFTDSYEDINSICLTVLSNLMEKFNLSPKSIGRLEVGTETIIDKSKSIKTFLMKLFEESGNYDIEGATTTNACYGGTNALFNTLNWIKSDYWDGRLGIVIAADIAVYERGPARPTGGAGAVAILLGPNAPIIFEPVRSTYMEHAYDFYKPDPMSEYPVVDGHFSIKCYLNALDQCYKLFKNKMKEQNIDEDFDLSKVDFCCFHTPFGKMVQKSFQRLVYQDIKDGKFIYEDENIINDIQKGQNYDDRKLQQNLQKVSKKIWENKTEPSLYISQNLGNIYTGALYGSLLSLICDKDLNLYKKRILMFSYGSGLMASMFSLKVIENTQQIQKRVNLVNRINTRIKISPQEFTDILQRKQELYIQRPPREEKVSEYMMFPGTFYLSNIDEKWRRVYKRSQNQNQDGKDQNHVSGVIRCNRLMMINNHMQQDDIKCHDNEKKYLF